MKWRASLEYLFNQSSKKKVMSEGAFQKKVIAKLKTIPQLWYVKVQQVSIRAIPDILICYKGKFIAWELKRDGKDATLHQAYNLDMICKAGGSSWTVTPSNFEEALKELYETV